MASSVLKRIAFAFPVLSIERLAGVIPTLSESSLSEILFFAISTSKLMMMGMFLICGLRFLIYDFREFYQHLDGQFLFFFYDNCPFQNICKNQGDKSEKDQSFNIKVGMNNFVFIQIDGFFDDKVLV